MKSDRIALITGASSGLGCVFARRLAQAGYDLIITGRRKQHLMLLANELKSQYGVEVHWVIAELSEEKDVTMLTRIIAAHHPISVLVNNAGFGSGKEFCQCELSAHLQMLQVHVTASLRLIHAVLPQMTGRREGTIINVSSLGALMPAPGSTMYSATKLFMKSFSESLHMEVRPYGIRVHCLCPGFVHTEFHQRRPDGKSPQNSGILPWMEPEKVVDQCLKSIEKGKVVFVPGIINRLLVRMVGIIPRQWYYYLIGKLKQQAVEPKPAMQKASGQVVPRFGFRYDRQHFIKKPVSLL